MSLKRFNVISGDCIEVMTSQLKQKKFDLIITDPPYNIGVDYGGGTKADLKKDYPSWSLEWLRLCFARLRDGGSIYVVSGQEYGANLDINLREVGFTMRNRITWHETFGVYCHNKFGRTSRPIYYAVKGKKFTFNADAVRVPSARQTKYNDKRANPKGKIIGDVWNVPRVCGTHKERQAGFPTQLPSELVRRMIRASSNKGESILDPFSGSGTVGMASILLGRTYTGIELNEEYKNKSVERAKNGDPS